MIVQSEQDVKTFAWPERVEDLFDLSKISHYAERPIEILIQYREIVREAQSSIMYAVYNQEKMDSGKLSTAETATQVRLEYDKIYNKLASFAELIALAWEKAQRTGYQYCGDVNVTANMTYPHDFKMKTILELLAEREAATNAAAPYAVVRSIDDDLLIKQYRNNPDKAADIMAFERWKPWKGKTPEDVALIVQSRDTQDPDRVLWENWDQVIEDVRLAFMSFSTIPEDQQRQILYDTAMKLNEKIIYTSAPDPLMPAVPMGDPMPEPAVV